MPEIGNEDVGKDKYQPSRLERYLVPVVGYTVTTAWAVSFFLGIFDSKYVPPAGVQALMMLVAGSAFALPIIRRAAGRD